MGHRKKEIWLICLAVAVFAAAVCLYLVFADQGSGEIKGSFVENTRPFLGRMCT